MLDEILKIHAEALTKGESPGKRNVSLTGLNTIVYGLGNTDHLSNILLIKLLLKPSDLQEYAKFGAKLIVRVKVKNRNSPPNVFLHDMCHIGILPPSQQIVKAI